MRIDQQLLMILLSEKEPVSAKKLAFSLGVSEKTVQKYTAQLKIILEGHGVEHQIKCTKKIKLNAKRNNVKFNSIQII